MLTLRHCVSTNRAGFTGRWLLWGLCGMLATLLGHGDRSLCAQTVAAPAAAQSSADDLASKRAQLAERIGKLLPESTPTKPSGGPTPAGLSSEDELDLLEALDLVYLQQQGTSEDRTAVEQAKKKLAQEAESLHNLGPAEAKPYSFFLLEDIRDQLSAETNRAEAIETDVAAAQQMLQAARASFEDAERERRQVHEATDGNKDAAQHATLARETRLAELKSNTAQETVNLRRAEIEVKAAEQELSKMRRDFLKEKVSLIAKDARFTQGDLQSRLQLLSKGREELRGKLKDAQKSLHRHEAAQQKTLADLQQSKAAPAVVDVATEAYQLARRVHCEEITLLDQRLAETERFRHFLNCRYEFANGKAGKEAVALWRGELIEALNQRIALQQSRALRLQEIRIDESTLLRRAHLNQDELLKPWFELQTRHIQRLVDLYETSLLQLQSSQRGLQRFLDDLQAGSAAESVADRLADARKAVAALWNYELAAVDDRPVTIGKIASGIFYLFLGIVLARLASRLVGRQVLPRLGLNEGATHAVQSIMFYALCVLFCLVSLELVNLPFAAFTFLGGAAAIGIGFGSQNIVNNFISGLILLAEQPLRVGDMVDIDGKTGTVERIGARSTRVRTIANHEIVVPNSQLLENKVTNLTLSDNLVRTAIGVTLSPTLTVDEVRSRLLAAAIKHPKVLAAPAPVVLFLGFTKTDLSFELHFWLKLANLMECRVVESEVREAMSKLLDSTDAATSSIAPTVAGAAPIAKPLDKTVAGKISNDKAPERPTLRKAG